MSNTDKELDFTVGRWAVVPGYASPSRLYPNIMRIDAVTKMQIRENGRNNTSVKGKGEVMATFSTEDEAQKLIQTINGIRGEMQRRQSAATAWAMAAVHKKLGEAA
jgi:hypothetical protein